jgi:hypothetical protein
MKAAFGSIKPPTFGGGNGSEAVKQAQDTANRVNQVWQQNGNARGKIADEASKRVERIESDSLKRIERLTQDSHGKSVEQQAATSKKIDRIIEDTVTRTTRIKADAANREAAVSSKREEQENLTSNRLAQHWEQVEKQKTRASQQESRRREQLGIAAESLSVRQDMLISRGTIGMARMGGEVMRVARGFAMLSGGSEQSVEHIARMFVKWTAFMDIVDGGVMVFGTLVRQIVNIERYLLNARRAQLLLNEAIAVGVAVEAGAGLSGGVAGGAAGRAVGGGLGAAGAGTAGAVGGAGGAAAVGAGSGAATTTIFGISAGLAATVGIIAGALVGIAAGIYQLVNFKHPAGAGWINTTFRGFKTGEVDQDQMRADQRRSQELAQGVAGRQSIAEQLRSGRAALYGANPAQERENATRDLAQSMKDLKLAQTERANWLKGPQDSASLAAIGQKELGAYKEASASQQKILELTRQTTQELQSQLETQKQQVIAATKLVEQEKARFESTLARAARLPRAEQQTLVDINQRIAGGKASEFDFRHLDKLGYGKKLADEWYIKHNAIPGLKGGLVGLGESGVEAAQKLQAQAQAGVKKAQDAVTDSAAKELAVRKAIYDLVTKTAALQWRMAGFGPGGPPGADVPFEPEPGVPQGHKGHVPHVGAAPHGHGKILHEPHHKPHVEHGHAAPHPHAPSLKGPHAHEHANPPQHRPHEHHLEGQHASADIEELRGLILHDLVAAVGDMVRGATGRITNANVIG